MLLQYKPRDKNSWSLVGVIVAKCETIEKKQEILDNKKRLNKDRYYKNVNISEDKQMQDRKYETNLRTIVNAVRKGQQNITIKGSRAFMFRQILKVT